MIEYSHHIYFICDVSSRMLNSTILLLTFIIRSRMPSPIFVSVFMSIGSLLARKIIITARFAFAINIITCGDVLHLSLQKYGVL